MTAAATLTADRCCAQPPGGRPDGWRHGALPPLPHRARAVAPARRGAGAVAPPDPLRALRAGQGRPRLLDVVPELPHPAGRRRQRGKAATILGWILPRPPAMFVRTGGGLHAQLLRLGQLRAHGGAQRGAAAREPPRRRPPHHPALRLAPPHHQAHRGALCKPHDHRRNPGRGLQRSSGYRADRGRTSSAGASARSAARASASSAARPATPHSSARPRRPW